MTDGPRIAVEGYFRSNFGDDLMLASFAGAAPGNILQILDEPSLSASLRALPNLTSSPTGWVAQWRAFLGCDSYVLLGGSMFIDIRTPNIRQFILKFRRLSRRLARAYVLKARGGKLIVVGANIGPVETKLGRLMHRRFLRQASRVVVRDRSSQELLNSWGIPCLLAPDSALPLLTEMSIQTAHVNADDSGWVGVSVMKLPGLTVADSADLYEALATRLRDDLDVHQIRWFTCHQLAPSDEDVLSAIGPIAGIQFDEVLYRGDVQSFALAVARSHLFIGSRLHASIAALCAGVPTVVVAYSSKVSGAMEMLEPSPDVVPFDSQVGLFIDEVVAVAGAVRPRRPGADTIDVAKAHFSRLNG